MSNPYRLHYAPDNASLIVRLALEELGAPYTTHLVDRRQRAQDSPAYRALNPAGLIPVLETPDGPIFETGAILLWLADRHGALVPPVDSPLRGHALKWLFFLSNSLHAKLRMLFHAERFIGPDAERQADFRKITSENIAEDLQKLDRLAQPGPWLLTPDLSVLDLYLATLLRWCALYPTGGTGWFRLSDTPALSALAAWLEERPSVLRAIHAEGLGPTPFTAPRYATPREGSAT